MVAVGWTGLASVQVRGPPSPVRLLTVSQRMGQKRVLSAEPCGVLSVPGWARVNRGSTSNHTGSEAQAQLSDAENGRSVLALGVASLRPAAPTADQGLMKRCS